MIEGEVCLKDGNVVYIEHVAVTKREGIFKESYVVLSKHFHGKGFKYAFAPLSQYDILRQLNSIEACLLHLKMVGELVE